MATQEKLLKSLETLKHLISANQSSGGDVLQKKKEKIQHCNVVVDAIQNPSLKVSKNFSNLLNCTIDIFLQLCDDPEADIRMIADECLNKIIRGMNNGSINKIQIELHKGIKQNGSARSLRAALWRFALLAHHIRPQKGKVYVTNIIPALIKVIERNEESVHETLATSLPQIMNALGPFTMDYDIKGLLKACLNNVQNPSVAIRRMTASCVITICLNNRAPFVFLCYVFNYLFDLLIPVQESHSNQLILGALSCLKLIIPHFQETEEKHKMNSHFKGRNVAESCVSTDKLLQIYELCLYYTMHKDHNIVNSSLETLNILLNNLSLDLKIILLQKTGVGVGKSRIFHADPSKIRVRSPSQLSIATTLKSEENLLLDSDLTDFTGTDIEKWIDESKLSVINVNYVKEDKLRDVLHTQDNNAKNTLSENQTDVNLQAETPVVSSEYGNINMGTINDHYADSFKSESIADNMDKLILSDNSSEKSFSHRIEDKSVVGDVDYVGLNIDVGDFLDHDVSLLFCSRLIIKQFLLNGIQNTTIPEPTVRVSIKNLALTCISTIVQIYPNVLVKYLDRNASNSTNINTKVSTTDVDCVSAQRISDVLLYECHDDPQIRGVIRVLIANFIRTVLLQSFGDFHGWIEMFSDYNDGLVRIQYLIHLLSKGLQDESSTCTRQCLTSLTTCLSPLLESEYSVEVVSILNYLPLMAQDPYWLVKVKLIELITTFSYVTVEHVTKGKEFQNKVIHNILLELLKDDDQRVRNGTSLAIIKIIPLLYFEQNLTQETKITYKAILHRNINSTSTIENAVETNIKMLQQIENLPFPYKSGTNKADFLVKKSLSRIITKLYRKLLTQSTKYYTLGCIETLCNLSYAYPITVYRSAWNCFKNCTVRLEKPTFSRSNSTPVQISDEILTSSKDLLSLTVNLLTTTTVVYDTNCHLHLIKLVGNLFAGKWLENLKPSSELSPGLKGPGDLWDLFTDKQLGAISEEYLVHLVKILNIYAHVIDENNLSQSKPTLPNLQIASNISPLKRRKSDLGFSSGSTSDKRVMSPGKAVDNDKKSDAKPITMGFFSNSPHYMKIYDILKVAYNNYKVTLDTEASENFLNFLKTVLYSMCQILEIATLNETGRIAEELLQYLKSTFNLEPTKTVQCVRQLLKSLFGTNICSDADGFIKCLSKDASVEEVQGSGFFFHIAQVPFTQMSDCVGKFNEISKNEMDGDSIVMGYVHRKDYKKIVNRNMDQILGNYIRIFEPMVIKSLKHYTMTSDTKLQAHVLQLLSQLVLLRVNYCLLDSEQVFIDFVLKQFQYMEEGQIGYANELIPKIFQFLVHLSYGKHTKSIIVIPKIIQLCDGLMASGQSPKTHCIPALKPIVEDVFLLRNKSNTSDFKELETTREVLVSMMLKLIEYSEIIDLLVLILKESKYCENNERWMRWSKQVFDIFMLQLRNNKIELESSGCMDAARRLLFTLHPSVYKPISHIFIALFEEAIDVSVVQGDRFLAKVNLLLLMTSQLSENKFLLKIEEIQSEIPPHCIFERFKVVHDPLNVSKTTGIFDGITPEVILLKYIFRTIGVAAKYCVQNEIHDEKTSIVQQLHCFMSYCLYLFQSGTHNKITTIGISLLNGEMEDVVEGVFLDATNKCFLQLRPTCPLLTFQWCYILTLLNYNDRMFWADIIQITHNYGIDMQLVSDIEPKINCINKEIVRIGGSIVFADYLSEHILSDGEQMAWLLVNNINLIVENHEEPPIFELLGSIHRNVSASSLLIQAIDSKCIDNATISTKAKILKCLENVHESQTGTLLKFLLPKVLDSKILAISRQASSLASRKVEFLLTLNAEEVQKQLPKEELSLILERLVSLKLVKRHETLIGLLNKLSSQFYDFSPLEFDQRRSIKAEYIKNLTIDKCWYLTQVKQRCLSTDAAFGYSEILNKLSYDELWTIMNHKDFNKKIIYDCLAWCMNHLDHDADIPDILQASAAIITKTVNSLRTVVPKSHHVYRPYSREATHTEVKYSNRLTEILEEESFFQFLIDLIPCVTEYIACVSRFDKLVIPNVNLEDFTRFAVICLEIISFNIDTSTISSCFNVNFTSSCLRCADLIFKDNQLCNNLAPDAQVSWLCSAINSLFKLVSYLLTDLEPLPSPPVGTLKEALNNIDTVPAGQAVQQLYVLVCWLEKVDFNTVEIPNYLMQSIMSIVISLARLPLVNSYVLTPPTAWKSGWFVQLSGAFLTQVPPLQLEYLQEVDILEEFIYRILLLGWTSRTQFEETWVSLLSALSPNTSRNEQEDINAITHSNTLTVQAITAFLLQTLYILQPGNKCVSSYIHVPRDSFVKVNTPTLKKLKTLHKRFSQKLLEYPDCLKGCRRHMNVFEKLNIEKVDSSYSFSQMSLEYLRISAGMFQPDEESYAGKVCKLREDKLQDIGLDLRSCLQFQLDLYSQWLSADEPVPLRLLQEIVKAVVQSSDIFNDRTQFQWMLTTFLELSKTHAVEDEIVHLYLVIGLCKAAAVINPDKDVLDYIKKIISQSLKNTFLSSRITGLHGLLFMLQMCVLDNTVICGISDDMQLFLPIAIDYIEYNISSNNTVLQQSEEHTLLVWALVFYVIENIEVPNIEESFVETVFTNLLTTLTIPEVNASILLPLIKGVESLLLKKRIPKQFRDKIIKYATSQFKRNSPNVSLPAAQLLFTCLYMEYSDHIDNSEDGAIVPSNPDHLVQSIENISAIFDKIKKGYPFEVDLLSISLSNLLTDIFSPSDILTKVISEFLSPHQRHPMQLCKVVFNIFESAIQQSQLSLLQDWVVFSLTNFTQSFSIGMATWCLTCFFISASNNIHLRNLFPYVQKRMGRYEYEDRKFLCIAGTDFYNNLTDTSQKNRFISTLVSVKDQADMPFNELLLCL